MCILFQNIICIILLFSFTDPVQCQVLEVELKNDALESQSSRVGIYKLSSTVNGRPSWTKSESQAQYILGQFALSYSLALVYSIPSWEIAVVHVGTKSQNQCL